MSSQVVLVGLSAREVAEHERLVAAAARIDAGVAHLQIGDPSLSTALTRLADAGVSDVSLVGVSLGTQAPAQSWLRRIAGHWWRERGADAPVVRVATALLRNDLDALEASALRDIATLTRPISGAEAPLTSSAWEDVPGHRHQVLLCRGPRCSAAGAERTLAALNRSLTAHGLGDDDVLVTVTGCQFPCNHAPVLSVQPDDVWYGGVDAVVVEQIAADHLVDGRPVAEHRLARTRRTQTQTPSPQTQTQTPEITVENPS